MEQESKEVNSANITNSDTSNKNEEMKDNNIEKSKENESTNNKAINGNHNRESNIENENSYNNKEKENIENNSNKNIENLQKTPPKEHLRQKSFNSINLNLDAIDEEFDIANNIHLNNINKLNNLSGNSPPGSNLNIININNNIIHNNNGINNKNDETINLNFTEIYPQGDTPPHFMTEVNSTAINDTSLNFNPEEETAITSNCINTISNTNQTDLGINS